MGKSTLVKNAMDDTKTTFVYVDCVQCSNENEISKYIAHTLFEKNPNSPSDLPNSFSKLVEKAKEKTIPQKFHYFVFDNTSRIYNRKLFKKLLSLKSMLRQHTKFILICDGYIPFTRYCTEFLLLSESFVQIFMEPPSCEHLKVVLSKMWGTMPHPEVFPVFVGLLHQSFSTSTNDINYYLYLSRLLYPVYIGDLTDEKVKEGEVSKLYTKKFKVTVDALRYNLYLPVGSLEDIDTRAEMYDETNQVDIFSKAEETQIYGQTTKNGLTYLEGVLLISAYIACYNPEFTDQKLFVKHKG